jgi:hypothetical protein
MSGIGILQERHSYCKIYFSYNYLAPPQKRNFQRITGHTKQLLSSLYQGQLSLEAPIQPGLIQEQPTCEPLVKRTSLPGILQGRFPFQPLVDRPPTRPCRGLTAPHSWPLYTLTFTVRLCTAFTGVTVFTSIIVLLSRQGIRLVLHHRKTGHRAKLPLTVWV